LARSPPKAAPQNLLSGGKKPRFSNDYSDPETASEGGGIGRRTSLRFGREGSDGAFPAEKQGVGDAQSDPERPGVTPSVTGPDPIAALAEAVRLAAIAGEWDSVKLLMGAIERCQQERSASAPDVPLLEALRVAKR
jgi:hypothetical protein